MSAFDQIHQAGVEHDDVAERNVLVNEQGRVSVIDFEHAFPTRCWRRVPIPALGDLGPDRNRLLCDELWNLGWSMRMWKPRTCLILTLVAGKLLRTYSYFIVFLRDDSGRAGLRTPDPYSGFQ